MTTENSSDSEEEILIYAELEQNVNINKYRTVHVLGINENNPIIQMDDSFYAGKFVHPLGTYMFFEEDPEPKSTDPLFDKLPEKSLRYLFKTRKYLNMEHAYVTPKAGKEQDLHNQLQQPDDDVKPVNFKSVQEAIETFKNEWDINNTIDLENVPKQSDEESKTQSVDVSNSGMDID